MKLKFVLPMFATAILIASAMPYHAFSQQTAAPEDTTNNPPSSGTNNLAVGDSNPKPYPLHTCVVDGMKLGSMGDPYVFVYQGQEVKMCCAGCKPKFDKDPDKYMKTIKDAEAAAKK
jgi:YHS domain-containing protein